MADGHAARSSCRSTGSCSASTAGGREDAIRQVGEPAGRRRRGRPGVRRRHARARALDLHVRRRGRRHPARHPRRQGRSSRATRSCVRAVPRRASTGTATRWRCASASRRKGDGHVRILAQLAEILMDPDQRRGAARGHRPPTRSLALLTSDGDRRRHEGRPLPRPRRRPRSRTSPEPTAGPGDVKIRVRNCSTCGTDVKIFQLRPPPHRAAAGRWGTRSPARSSSRRRGRRLGGRRPGAGDRRDPVRHVRRVPARAA